MKSIYLNRRSNEIHLTQDQFSSTEAGDDHGHGWNGTFDKLEKCLAHQLLAFHQQQSRQEKT
jgi:hypothetical protein